MTTLNFPNNPNEGDKWTDPNGAVWEFKGYGWKEFNSPSLQSLSDVSSNVATIDDRLIWDGSNWIPGIETINLLNFNDVIGTPIIGDYLISDGTNWNMASSLKPMTYAQMKSNAGDQLISSGSNPTKDFFVFDNIIQDTNGMTDSTKNNIRIRDSGFYNIIANFCLFVNDVSDGKLVNILKLSIYVYDKFGNRKYTYMESSSIKNIYEDVDSQFDQAGYLITYPYQLCRININENFDVDDTLYLEWDINVNRIVYKKNITMSAMKIEAKI